MDFSSRLLLVIRKCMTASGSFLSGTLVQLDGVELKESVFEIIRVVRDPAVAVGSSLSSTLMLGQSQILKGVHLKNLQYGTG
jgi:hypothetical protein